MKKFCKQLIIFILITMTLLNSIVPCNYVLAEDEFPGQVIGDYHAFSLSAFFRRQGFNSEMMYSPVLIFNHPLYYYDTGINKINYIEKVGHIVGVPTEIDFSNYSDCRDWYCYYVSDLMSDTDDSWIFVKNEEWDDLQYVLATYSIDDGKYKIISEQKGTINDIIQSDTTGRDALKNIRSKEEEVKDMASLFEHLITAFLLIIGDGVNWLISAVCGEITMDSLIFNTYENTSINIFEGARYGQKNALLNDDVSKAIAVVYNAFTGLAVSVFLTSLLYIGLKILLGSTGSAKAKYQEFLVTWIKGIVILFAFPSIMRLMIDVNYAVVEEIRVASGEFINVKMPSIEKIPFQGLDVDFQFGGKDTRADSEVGYSGLLRKKAERTGRAVYALCWILLLVELVKFILIYFKRFLMIIFLYAVFPLVTMTYAIDKVGDGKSQAFSSWLKEFSLNVFLQSFHAVNYVIVMSIVTLSETGTMANYILMIIAMTYLSKGDKILWSIFGQSSRAGTVKSAAETVFKTEAAVGIARNTVKGIKKSATRIGKLNDYRRRNITDPGLRNAERSLREKDEEFLNAHPSAPPLEVFDHISDADERGMDRAINTLVNPNASNEDIENAVANLNGYMNDPYKKAELSRRFTANGMSEDEVAELFDEHKALRRLEVNVNNNLNILVNRKVVSKSTLYGRMNKGLLALYGLNDARLADMKSAYASMEKFDRLNGRRIVRPGRGSYARRHTYGDDGDLALDGEFSGESLAERIRNGNMPSSNRLFRDADGRMYFITKDGQKVEITGYVGMNKGIGNSSRRVFIGADGQLYHISDSGEASIATGYELTSDAVQGRTGVEAGKKVFKGENGELFYISDNGQKVIINGTSNSSTGNGKTNLGVNDARRKDAKNISNKRKKKAKNEELRRRRVAAQKEKKASNSDDPIKRNYSESKTVVKKKEKESSQVKQYKLKVQEIKRDQMEEVKRERQAKSTEEKILESAEAIVKGVSTNSMRKSYSNMARLATDASLGSSSTLEKILASERLAEEIEYVKSTVTTSDEQKVVNAAIQTAKHEARLDKVSSGALNRVNEMINDYLGEDSKHRNTREVFDTALAVETLNSGNATLDELWDSYHVVKNSNIESVKSKLNGKLDEFEMNLAVETLNHSLELEESSAQARVDEAIKIVKMHQDDDSVHREMTRRLDVVPEELIEGRMPEIKRVNEGIEERIPGVQKSEKTKEIERKLKSQARETLLSNREFMAPRGKSAYNIDRKKFSAEKDTETRRKAIGTFAKEVAKETIHDTSAIVGGVTGLAAYEAVDEHHNIGEIVSSVGIGSSFGAKTSDMAIHLGEETIGAGS